VVKCWHGHLKVGDACPASLCGGRLYDLKEPTSLLQFTGQLLMVDFANRPGLICCCPVNSRNSAPQSDTNRAFL
jgi:hypothetical protein